MNCLCNLFGDGNIWLLVIILLILYFGCNGGYGYSGGNGCGCGEPAARYGTCGCN